MAVTGQFFTVFAGEDIKLDDLTIGNVDITGWSLEFTARPYPSSGTVLFSKATGSGITLTSPGTGTFSLTIASADTATLGNSVIHWEVHRTDTGARTMLSTGFITVNLPSAAV